MSDGDSVEDSVALTLSDVDGVIVSDAVTVPPDRERDIVTSSDSEAESLKESVVVTLSVGDVDSDVDCVGDAVAVSDFVRLSSRDAEGLPLETERVRLRSLDILYVVDCVEDNVTVLLEDNVGVDVDVGDARLFVIVSELVKSFVRDHIVPESVILLEPLVDLLGEIVKVFDIERELDRECNSEDDTVTDDFLEHDPNVGESVTDAVNDTVRVIVRDEEGVSVSELESDNVRDLEMEVSSEREALIEPLPEMTVADISLLAEYVTLLESDVVADGSSWEND